MSMVIVAGPRSNLVENAVSIGPSVAADALFPTTNLADNDPSSIFRFGSLTTSPTITIDLDPMGGYGYMESWTGGTPNGWTEDNSGVGADVTQEVTLIYAPEGGGSAAKLSAGTNRARARIDLTLKTGASYQLRFAHRGDGATGAAVIRVQNLQTAKYLTSGGAWQTSTVNVASRVTATYDYSSVTFAVESYSTCQAATATVRVTIENTTGGDAYFDTIDVQPVFDFVSFHGHNIDTGIAVTVRGSTNNFGGSDDLIGTLTPLKPSFWGYVYTATKAAGATYRWVRLAFTGTNSTTSGAIYIGHLVIGRSYELAGALYPMTVGYSDTQVRVPTRWGSRSYALGQSDVRTFTLTAQATSMSNRMEYLEELYGRCRGVRPLAVAPHNADGHTDVLFGRLSQELPHEWSTRSVAMLTSRVEELPFPFVTG